MTTFQAILGASLLYVLLLAANLTLFSTLVFATPGCVSASSGGHVLEEARLKTALDVLREVVDPADAFAADACALAQKNATAEAREGVITVAAATAQVAKTRERCAGLRATFARMRSLHDEAATLLESGAISETEARVKELREAWKRLDRGGS